MKTYVNRINVEIESIFLIFERKSSVDGKILVTHFHATYFDFQIH